METVEHFAKISLVARMLGGERLISQEEVLRLQALRGKYGIAAPAPICLDDDLPGTGGTPIRPARWCRRPRRRASGSCPTRRAASAGARRARTATG